MRTLRLTSLLLVVVLFATAGCLLPTVSIVDAGAQATIQAATINAAVGQTQMAAGTPATATLSPTATFTPSSTPTASLTPTSTLTFTPLVIFTVTPIIPQISVSVPTNCREGPGTVYQIAGALLVGDIAQPLARDPTGHWWLIPNPDSGGDYCWVSDKYATLSGYTDTLPVYTPWPTPIPTYTATPSPGFDVSFDGLVDCTTDWWVELRLDNTGGVTFRSVEIELKDLTNSDSFGDDWNSFIDNPDCSSTKSKSTLLPDKTAVVSSPTLPYDPAGHRLRATVTLCDERDLDGDCVTDTITFKP
jgi:hypothetical protein